MYTVWYCVVGMSILFSDGRDWKLKDLSAAKKITVGDFKQNHWFLKKYRGGWVEVRDERNAVVSSSRKDMKQLGLFGEGV